MNMLFKMAFGILSALALIYLSRAWPSAAIALFAVLMLLMLASRFKTYSYMFPRNMSAKEVLGNDRFGAFILSTVVATIGSFVFFGFLMLAGGTANWQESRSTRENTAYRNVRAEADKVCPEVIGKFPNNVVNTKAFRDQNPFMSDAQVEAIQRSVWTCKDYAKYGAEWRADVAKDTLDCIGWKAGMVRDGRFSWCEYYNNTPVEPTPEQIAAFQQARYADDCKEREQAGTIRRLVELRYSKWCDGYQPQQIDATATTASTTADKPATGNDLWK